MGEELKKCPFCGSDGIMFEDVRYPNSPLEGWLVYGALCSNSDCIMHQTQKFYSHEELARKAWNKRYSTNTQISQDIVLPEPKIRKEL